MRYGRVATIQKGLRSMLEERKRRNRFGAGGIIILDAIHSTIHLVLTHATNIERAQNIAESRYVSEPRIEPKFVRILR
jgi:hypothetical protein